MKEKEIMQGTDICGRLAIRYEMNKKCKKHYITDDRQGAECLEKFYYYNDLNIDYTEYVVCLFLSKAGALIGGSVINEGNVDSSIFDLRKIAAVSILCGASKVIIGHNHPQGNPKPSYIDKSITIEAINALKLFDVKVIDHIILGDYDEDGKHSYYSMSLNGDL